MLPDPIRFHLVDFAVFATGVDAQDRCGAINRVIQDLFDSSANEADQVRQITTLVHERDRQLPMAIGRHVAILHLQCAFLSTPVVAGWFTLNKQVEWSAPDRLPVRLVFATVGGAGNTEPYWDVLAAATSLIDSDDFVAKAVSAVDSRELRQVVGNAVRTLRVEQIKCATPPDVEARVAVRVGNRLGLHARPAILLVDQFIAWLEQFPDDARPTVRMEHREQQVTPDNIMNVMLFGPCPFGEVFFLSYSGCSKSTLDQWLRTFATPAPQYDNVDWVAYFDEAY